MAGPTSGSDAADELPARIGWRYGVEAQLAVGGMGSVYRVRDEATGRSVALKRLRPEAGPLAAALFRREYHTLVLLKHPRVIEVFDYGVDGETPYYTMELLDGVDLGAFAPVDHVRACALLRDVASSLALLAAHRLVHRDLTGRNVRVTSDGRCKLIDFGVLAPFGFTDQIVGTPPYLPPEALNGMPLDQRADLYSLGALSYFLLSKSHAYPARSLDELPAAWARRVERPSARVQRLIEQGAALTPVPSALDDLVLSLLSPDPMARPQSAGEVIDRLEAAAGLQPEPGMAVAQSHVLSAAFVGRSEPVERARRVIASASAGQDGVLVIRHAPGAGGTRLLSEIGLEARLSGVTVLRVDAAAQRGPMVVARALAGRLVTALPAEATAAVPVELRELGWLRARGSSPPSERPGRDQRAQGLETLGAPMAQRLRLQAALDRWFHGVAQQRPLALLIDNAAQMDEGSAAWLARLAAPASEGGVLLVLAVRSGDAMAASAALEWLQGAGECLELEPLTEADTVELLQSIFGPVPNVERLAHWSHRSSGGNPLRLLELAQHLVTREVARYVRGTWVLPQELPAEIMTTAEHVSFERVDRLGAAARALGGALSLHRGHASIDLCMALVESGPGAAMAALDELTSAGVLLGYEDSYQFAQQALRQRLLDGLDEDSRRTLHRQLGEHFARVADPDLSVTLDAGWHLLHGGDAERGAEILRGVGLQLVDADELREAIPVLEASVAVYRRLERPRHELCGLVHPLAFAGYYVERRLADEYGDEALDLLSRETGLTFTARLRRYVGTHLALLAGLVYAVQLHLFGRPGGLRELNQKIAITGGLSTALTAAAVTCTDTATALRRARVFDPSRRSGCGTPVRSATPWPCGWSA